MPPMSTLTPEEARRYARHLSLTEVGPEGQAALGNARVLLVGAGGLGSPAALYLAAAGVGTIGLVDHDAVDASNLQRQVLFGTSDVGRPKVDAGATRLADLNPLIDVVPHPVRLDAQTAMDIMAGYDIVVDGSDNFATRYLVNDACVLLGRPVVYGAVLRFEGQVSVFAADNGPCYRCMYPQPPDAGSVPNCADAGVLGVLPGIIGGMQAAEAIKLILGAGDPLVGRLLMFDAMTMRFREVTIARDSGCPMCGDNRTIHELIDYDEFCGTPREEENSNMSIPEIEPKQLKQKMDANEDIFVLDVREPHEAEICKISDNLIPMSEIPARIADLDYDRETVVYCRTGVRSASVVEFLRDSGFSNVSNLRGGVHAWSDDVDNSFPKY